MIIEKEKIQEAKEKLGIDNAYKIKDILELEDFDEKNLKSCCPFHEEKTPSFIYSHKLYSYHCYGACSRSYDLIDALMIKKGMTYLEAVQQLFEYAGMRYSFGEKGTPTKHQYRYPKEVKCDNKDRVYAYLGTRMISKETVDYADIRQDEHGNCVFQYYDTNDVLSLVKYRPSRKVDKGENKQWCQKDADTTPLLFNMNRINVGSPLLICEGEIDCLAAIECGFTNAVSVPFGAGNFSWIEENFDWLEQFNTIIICSDNDAAGRKMQKEAIYRIGSWKTKVVCLPETFEKPDGKTVRIKDLNEALYRLGKEKTYDLIVNAKDTPVPGVIDYTKIKKVDLDEIDGIKTGIKELDRYLMKLFFGTLTIVTGINGGGKSSFLSQLVAQCIDQGDNAFLYSGELPNFQSGNWIDYIIAGQRHLKQYRYDDTDVWKVVPEAKEAINEYYDGKLFIYEDGYSRKVSDILKTMEDTVRKYGTKLLIIDNLTAVNLENNDNNKYDKQSEFVTTLIDFAKKFNVAIVLVVHPHKIDTMRRLSKMDVQGISAIIDLAHRILSFYRVQEEDHAGKPKRDGKGWIKKPIPYDVLCDVLKDRMLGFEGESVGMYYDRPSKRFFTSETDLDYKYKWDASEYQGELPFPPEQLHREDESEVYGSHC